MPFRRNLLSFSLVCATFFPIFPAAAVAQDDHHRGRKYKAPPETSHIEVEVLRSSNGKPIPNAAVVFNPEKDGKDEGNLEVKTGPDGKAAIDVIPTGSKLRVQVIADGFATFAEDYLVSESSKTINVKMIRPRAQISTYQDNSGKAADRRPGVQEPVRPKPGAVAKPESSSPPAASAKPATQDGASPDAPTPDAPNPDANGAPAASAPSQPPANKPDN